ncbi:MAG TPA: hydantoinase/oxoprolinase family protein [Pseudonocardiaceae bacterium]|jgi:N-methylhydantoinase A|nr:hydantoinase/oxoprolinase family protein [Pseudonocardiaceae bacterium]
MYYYVGVDIGGTFTDCVLVDRQGNHRTAKVLSTKDDPVAGVLAGLGRLAETAGVDLPTLLEGTERLGHGTTIGTNAVLERRGARVGLVATAGHGDALAMMRGAGRVAGRSIEGVFSVHGSRLPAPLIVPGAVVEVQERIDASGKVVVELDTDAAVERITRMIAEYELDSIAVALLWSFANPAHEKALAQAIPQVVPDAFVSCSSEVSPRLGEYERTVATVLNGYVGPACSRYLSELESRLATPLLVMQSNGGVLPASTATPLGTIDSGPAGGLIGVATLAGAYGHDHVVATDMGGTSFDLGLVIDGKPVVAEENVIDQYTYRLPNLDVRSIACGGGSIAWFDEATGGLRVGPASAGAEPGPACYGHGGVEPTVTDADVVLGLIRAEEFLDGRMPLDRDAAVAAVGRLAERLDLTVEETAAGILRINNMQAATVIRQQTLERGLDPRDFVLYAFGGAGPVHAFGYAAESGVREVVIPLGNGASTLSAYGIASGDVVLYHELEHSLRTPFDNAALATAVAEVRDTALAELAATGAPGAPLVEIDALMRYREQLMHSLEIPVSLPADGATLLADFDREYVRRYGEGGTALFQAVEVFALRARVSVPAGIPIARPELTASPLSAGPEQAHVYWPGHGHGWTRTGVYRGAPDGTVTGPALVQLAHTTVAVPHGAALSAGPLGELHLKGF